MHRFGLPSGWGAIRITVASPARTVMKKLGKIIQPWLSVICASVRPVTSNLYSVSVDRVT
jgi:hypothetical protein